MNEILDRYDERCELKGLRHPYISPPGFSLLHCPRTSGRGGGVAFLVRESFKVDIIHTPKFPSFEAICIIFKHSSMTANFICIYRPPGCTTMFYDEFHNFLENTLHFQDELYIFGYFNIHLDKPSVTTWSFLDIFGHIFFAPARNISNSYLRALVRSVHHTIELQKCKSCNFLRWFI